MEQQYHVGVVGSGVCGEKEYSLAREIGYRIGNRGWTLICGGLGGIMEGASRGCIEAGGMTVGLLPGLRREEANPYIRLAIPTGLGEGRNLLVVRASDILVAISGGHGTLSEIGFALKTGKPVVGIRSFEHIPEIIRASTPDEVLRILDANRIS
ncbi:MAG: TIGR00725 family protein [Deltaproteobacteria bacterium]